MNWRVTYNTAVAEWREADVDVRLAVLRWFKALTIDGPPLLSEVDDEFGFLRTIAPTGTVVTYFVDESQHLIAVVSLRS